VTKNRVLTGSADGTAILHDLVLNVQLHTFGKLFGKPITAVALSKGETFAIVASSEAHV